MRQVWVDKGTWSLEGVEEEQVGHAAGDGDSWPVFELGAADRSPDAPPVASEGRPHAARAVRANTAMISAAAVVRQSGDTSAIVTPNVPPSISVQQWD